MQHEKLRWGRLFSMPVSPLGLPGGLMSFHPERVGWFDRRAPLVHDARAVDLTADRATDLTVSARNF